MATAFRVCPLCEATCGLELTVEDGRVTAARGDADHVLSHGFICPKGAAFPQLVHDPDLDRTDYLVVLGANPWDSNGSLATAPDFGGRLKALQKRGGRFVVVDPRRTATARHADRHLAVRPGTDALLLFGVLHVLFAER